MLRLTFNNPNYKYQVESWNGIFQVGLGINLRPIDLPKHKLN